MPKKLLSIIALLSLLMAACGSSTAVEDATDEALTDDVPAEDAGDSAGGDGAGGDGAGDDSRTVTNGDSADSGSSEAEPGSSDDQSLIDESTGPLGILLFDDTLEASDAPSSARFEGEFTITGSADSDLSGTVTMTLSGAYDLANDASRMSMDMSELMAAAAAADSGQVPPGMEDFFTEPLQVIVIGDQGWLKWGILTMFVGEGDVWLELPAEEVADTTEGLGFSTSAGDPTEMLNALADANATVEDLGVESVNGVAARHWRALVDLEQLSAEATPEEQAELEAQFGDLNATEFPLDVWIGVDDGLIYRYILDLSNEAFFDDAGGEITSSTMRFDFFDYGQDQGITQPPAEEVVSGEALFGA